MPIYIQYLGFKWANRLMTNAAIFSTNMIQLTVVDLIFGGLRSLYLKSSLCPGHPLCSFCHCINRSYHNFTVILKQLTLSLASYGYDTCEYGLLHKLQCHDDTTTLVWTNNTCTCQYGLLHKLQCHDDTTPTINNTCVCGQIIIGCVY